MSAVLSEMHGEVVAYVYMCGGGLFFFCEYPTSCQYLQILSTPCLKRVVHHHHIETVVIFWWCNEKEKKTPESQREVNKIISFQHFLRKSQLERPVVNGYRLVNKQTSVSTPSPPEAAGSCYNNFKHFSHAKTYASSHILKKIKLQSIYQNSHTVNHN